MANNLPKQKVSPDTWIKLGIWIAGGVAVAYGTKKVLDYFKPDKKRNETEQKQIENELEAEKKKKAASYAPSVYSGFASIIAEAVFGYDTDNEAIYSVFKKLKNNTDYLMLTKAWGNPTRQVFPDFFVFYDTGKKLTLPAVLRYDMTSAECAKINSIMKSNGITYSI
jgi:hypothetical protein